MNEYAVMDKLNEAIKNAENTSGVLNFADVISVAMTDPDLKESLGYEISDIRDSFGLDLDTIDDITVVMYVTLIVMTKCSNDIFEWLVKHGQTPGDIMDLIEFIEEELEDLED